MSITFETQADFDEAVIDAIAKLLDVRVDTYKDHSDRVDVIVSVLRKDSREDVLLGKDYFYLSEG